LIQKQIAAEIAINYSIQEGNVTDTYKPTRKQSRYIIDPGVRKTIKGKTFLKNIPKESKYFFPKCDS
jgi:hypothetical protein